jgi:hypothetical protein
MSTNRSHRLLLNYVPQMPKSNPCEMAGDLVNAWNAIGTPRITNKIRDADVMQGYM